MQNSNTLQNGIQELTVAEIDEVNGGLFFALLAFDIAIWGYNAYQLSK